MGPQSVLLTVLMLSGLDGVPKPALAVRPHAPEVRPAEK